MSSVQFVQASGGALHGRVIRTLPRPISTHRMTVRREYSRRYKKDMWVLYSPTRPEDPTAKKVYVNGVPLYQTEGHNWGYIMLLANWIRVGAEV